MVFIDGEHPETKNPYLKFIKRASTEELLYLANYEKPNIRCYAFSGLVEKNYAEVRKIFAEHIKDTSQILQYHGSCTASYMTVSEFMLGQLHPFGSKSSQKFSRKEYDKYAKLIEDFHNKRPATNSGFAQ